jgi:hypothetical protein
MEAVRLELARERTRRRALEQEKEKLEGLLIQATRAKDGGKGGMLIDLGGAGSSPRGLLASGAASPRGASAAALLQASAGAPSVSGGWT